MTFDDNTKNILLIESSKPSFIKDVNSREFEEKITNIATIKYKYALGFIIYYFFLQFL